MNRTPEIADDKDDMKPSEHRAMIDGMKIESFTNKFKKRVVINRSTRRNRVESEVVDRRKKSENGITNDEYYSNEEDQFDQNQLPIQYRICFLNCSTLTASIIIILFIVTYELWIL